MTEHLAREFPEYVEVHALLSLAGRTWPRYGIGAAELAAMDAYERELIRVFLEG